MSTPVPPYLALLKGESLFSKMEWFKNYQKTYIFTGRFRPVIHVMSFICVLGYAMEYPHLRRTCLAPLPAAVAAAAVAPPPTRPAIPLVKDLRLTLFPHSILSFPASRPAALEAKEARSRAPLDSWST